MTKCKARGYRSETHHHRALLRGRQAPFATNVIPTENSEEPGNRFFAVFSGIEFKDDPFQPVPIRADHPLSKD